MKKRRIITLALCAMLAVGSLGTMTACGSSGTAVIEDANGQRTADMYKFLEENPSFNTSMKKGFSSADSSLMELSDLYVEDGNLAASVTYKVPVNITEETFKEGEAALGSIKGMMTSAIRELTEKSGYPDAEVIFHYISMDGENLFDMVLSADDAKLVPIAPIGSTTTTTTTPEITTPAVPRTGTITLQEYVELANQASAGQLETSDYSVKIYVSGDESIGMDFTLKTLLSEEQIIVTKPVLLASTEQLDASVMLNEMKQNVGLSNPSVTVRYLNADGTLIAEKTFR